MIYNYRMVSTNAIMRRLVWIAVLSCLVPPISGDCNTAKAASSGTCSAVGAISGIASIFLCAGTLGVGCGAIAVAGIAAALCSSVSDNLSCGGGGMDPGKLLIQEISKYGMLCWELECAVLQLNEFLHYVDRMIVFDLSKKCFSDFKEYRVSIHGFRQKV